MQHETEKDEEWGRLSPRTPVKASTVTNWAPILLYKTMAPPLMLSCPRNPPFSAKLQLVLLWECVTCLSLPGIQGGSTSGNYIRWQRNLVDWVAGTVSCNALQVTAVTVLPNDSELHWAAQLNPDLTEFQQRHLLSSNSLKRYRSEISDS